MPTYEYKCHACGREFEVQQRISDPELTDCDVCGAAGKVERLLSATAFQLKGGGWYKDLYASSKPAESKPSEASKPAAEATSSGGDSGSSGGSSSTGTSGSTSGGSTSSSGGGSGTSAATSGAS